MRPTDIPLLRLQQQQVSVQQFKKVQELVTYMGAMQAQDEAMCKWAAGIRLPGVTLKTIEAAMDKGEIFRTHVLRPTWHLVSAQDIHWMLALTGPHIKNQMGSRHRQLGITPAVLTKSRKIIEKTLAGRTAVVRSELVNAFAKAGIVNSDNRVAHLLFMAELDGLIASGPMHNGKHTYALLDERVRKKKLLSTEEALAELAYRYFTSHGPATLQDFTWWSGLTLGNARKALEAAKRKLHSEKTGDNVYWMAAGIKTPGKNAQVFLLPAYDEYLISYKDRSAALDKKHRANAMSGNGIFFPVVVANGKVTGIWKRTIRPKEVSIEVNWLNPLPASLQTAFKKAAAEYAGFIDKKLSLP